MASILKGRAIFDPDEVAFDFEADDLDDRGPFYAWQLFIWKVNELMPEIFSTDHRQITVEDDDPAVGWTTEYYPMAKVLLPPIGSGDSILIETGYTHMFDAWKKAFDKVVSGKIHTH